MATKKTQVVVEIKTDSTQATAEANKTKEEVAGIGQAAASSIAELKELKKKLKEAAVGSEEFKKLTQAIDDTQESINAAKIGAGNFADIVGDLPGPIGEIGGKVSGLTAGLKQFSQVKFNDIKGSFKDLFDDVKDIGTNIAKTTGLTKVYEVANNAASKSLQFFGVSAKGATTASKGFGLAISGLLAATGLILLTSTIQAVSEAWDYYASRAERAEEAQKKLNDSLLKGAQVALDAESKSVKRSGDLLLAQAKAKGANANEIYNIEKNNRKLLLESQERYYNELKNKDSDEARAALSSIKDAKNEILIAELNFIDQKNKAIADKEKTANEKAAAQKKIDEEKSQKELLDKQKSDLEKKEYQFTIDKEEREYGEQLVEDAAKADAEREAKATKDKEEALKYRTQLTIDNYNREKNLKDLEKLNDDKLAQAKLDNLNAIGNATEALGAIIGQQTTAGKALGIATALINTYIGASEVIRAKSVLPEPFGTIQKIASVAGIIATGIQSVKSIMGVKVPSVKGASGAGGAMPSIPSMNVSAPLMAQASTTTLNQAQVNQIGNVAARAFVVESDVSGNQERIQRLNRAARIN
jgi:ribosomal protein S13